MLWNLCEPVQHINKYKVMNNMTTPRCIVSTAGRWGAVLMTLFIFNFNLKDQDFYKEMIAKDDGKLHLEG